MHTFTGFLGASSSVGTSVAGISSDAVTAGSFDLVALAFFFTGASSGSVTFYFCFGSERGGLAELTEISSSKTSSSMIAGD